MRANLAQNEPGSEKRWRCRHGQAFEDVQGARPGPKLGLPARDHIPSIFLYIEDMDGPADGCRSAFEGPKQRRWPSLIGEAPRVKVEASAVGQTEHARFKQMRKTADNEEVGMDRSQPSVNPGRVRIRGLHGINAVCVGQSNQARGRGRGARGGGAPSAGSEPARAGPPPNAALGGPLGGPF